MSRRMQVLSVVLITMASIALHLLPFLLYGAHPLGYDTGFYRRYLTQQQASFPNTSVPGLGDDALVPRVILDTLRLGHIPPDIILYGSYIAFFALLPVLIFFWLRGAVGARTALFAAALFTFSPVQYGAYWYMLWKNVWALCVLVLAFVAIEKRWWKTLVCLDIVLALSHKTTAIIYLLTLLTLFVIRKKDRLPLVLHAAITLACFALVNVQLVHSVVLSTPVGVFLDWGDYATYSLPLLIVIVAGELWRERRVPLTLLAFSLVSLAFPVLHLPFYERIFVFSDLALVALAAIALERIIPQLDFGTASWKPYALSAALCVALGLFLGTLWNQVQTLQPLYSSADIQRVEAFSSILPPDATVLTSSDEAPLFEGWTTLHIAAPGMLHDDHDLEEWEVLWSATSSSVQTVFLNDFPRPFYVATFEGMENLIGPPAPCMRRITPYLFEACAGK